MMPMIPLVVSVVASTCLFPITLWQPLLCSIKQTATTECVATTMDPSFTALHLIHIFHPFQPPSELSCYQSTFLLAVTQFDWLLVAGYAFREQSEVLSCQTARDTPNLPASTSCTQSTSSSQTSLSNEVLLFLVKTSFISCPLTMHTCLLNHYTSHLIDCGSLTPFNVSEKPVEFVPGFYCKLSPNFSVIFKNI